MKLGFIGLGNIGGVMARRLVKAGHALMVHDLDAKAVASLTAMGATAATSARDVAEKCDAVLLSLPTPAAVEAVALGADGLVQGSMTKIVVDLSTTGPTVARRVAEGLAAKGIHLIDGPVSGGVSGAEAGTLAIMTSGDAASQKAVEPVLKAIGQNIFYLGAEPGLGQTMKLVNNVILASNTLACLEGMVLGAKAGLDTKLMFDVLNASSGRSFMSEKRVPQAITERAQGFPVRFAAGLMHKDVKLCLEEAERFGVPMFMGPAARQYLSMALAMGSGPEDFVSTIQHMEKLAGIEVRATPKEAGG